ncbi:MAG: glutathione S-transferase family protein [Burkholderiales bacterium]|jgi:glutathione S-transferase|nr:glutathione S-transferase family protein [Burkholderiales bacterium]
MLKLYEHPMSAFVMKVKMALNEKGLAWTAEVPSGLMVGQAGGGFLAANPRAEIPALVDGDVAVFDSTVILEYLEDKWPQPALMPADPALRARARMLEDVMDTHYEPNNWGLMEVLVAQRATGALADQMVAFGKARIGQLQHWLDGHLGDAPWFNGATCGWADVCIAPVVARSKLAYGIDPATPRIAAWLGRVMARPSLASVIEQMHTAFRNLPDLAAQVRDGTLVRQYRDHRLEWILAAGGLPVVQEGLDKGTIRFSRPPGRP